MLHQGEGAIIERLARRLASQNPVYNFKNDLNVFVIE
jgi:hypothetical protein